MSLLPITSALTSNAVPFQLEDVEFIKDHPRCVLGHDTGLGKTFMSLLAWKDLPSVSRVLIVGTLSSIAAWQVQIKQWGGGSSVFMQGYSDPTWKTALDKNVPGIYVTTYATFRGLMANTDGKVSFDLLILDELDQFLRKRDNQTHKALKRVDSRYFFGCTATWASRGPQDLWPILNYIDPKAFPSFWQFVYTYCSVADGIFGKEIEGVRNAPQLRNMLRSKYYVARKWAEAGRQFTNKTGEVSGPIVRRSIVLPMNPEQTTLYEQLQSEMMLSYDVDHSTDEVPGFVDTQYIVTPSKLALLTRLLQIAISPRILIPKATQGNAVEYLKGQVREQPHTVIFTMFRPALEILEEAFVADKYPPKNIFKIHGGIKPEELMNIVEQWKLCKGVLLCTIAFAQSFRVDTTDTAYFLGFSWDPNANVQAEGRLRGFSSAISTPCLVNYIIMQDTAYEDVKEVVNGKHFTVNQFLHMKYGTGT